MTQGVVVNGAKAVRMLWMLVSLLDELHRDDLDEAARDRMQHLLERTLVELGSALPDDLLDELAVFVVPASGEHPTASELRMFEAQLLGWLEGLLSTAHMAVVVEEHPPAA
jgi:hypothetical protein